MSSQGLVPLMAAALTGPYILQWSRIWVICQRMLLFIIILVIMQVKDQDQSCLGSQLLHYVQPRLRQGY